MKNTYRALDVRECRVLENVEYRKPYGAGGTGSVCVPHQLRVIVIAQKDNDKARVRFEFVQAYEYQFLGETRYTGYIGDWNLIVPGDYFTIQETDTYDKVTILSTL